MRRREGRRVLTQSGEDSGDRALLVPANRSDDAGALIEDAGRLGLSLDSEVASKLVAYLHLLQRWNATYNLTAVREPQAMYVQHLLDCLAVIRPVVRVLGEHSGRVVDVGSGAGLPGVVIAAACPELEVCCIDTVGKKVAFVRQVAVELGLRNLRAEQARVENLKPERPFDLVTSRAFASLLDFVQVTRGLIARSGRGMAMKGRVPDDEIAALPSDVEVFHVEQLAIPALHADRCLVWMCPLPGAT